MPYFKWRGLTSTGISYTGKGFARSADDLKKLLKKNYITLVDCTIASPPFFMLPITLAEKIAFFEQLTTLIGAGILIPEALSIIAETMETPLLQEVLYEISTHVENGSSLSNALLTHPKIFDTISCQLIKAGEESGQLSSALTAVCAHLQLKRDFGQKMRSALAMPFITLCFFMVVATILFLVVLPHFASFFAQFHKELPPLTRYLLAFSTWIKSRSFLITILGVALVILLLWRLTRHTLLKKIKDQLIFTIPFAGSCFRYRFLAHFFQSLSLLLKGGDKVVPALHIMESTVDNKILQTTLHQMVQEVTAGSPLSNAMAQAPWLFDKEAIAMVHVGEESGRLTTMLSQLSAISQRHLERRLSLIQTTTQPILLVFLGLCATILVIALYGPLCTLADIAV